MKRLIDSGSLSEYAVALWNYAYDLERQVEEEKARAASIAQSSVKTKKDLYKVGLDLKDSQTLANDRLTRMVDDYKKAASLSAEISDLRAQKESLAYHSTKKAEEAESDKRSLVEIIRNIRSAMATLKEDLEYERDKNDNLFKTIEQLKRRLEVASEGTSHKVLKTLIARLEDDLKVEKEKNARQLVMIEDLRKNYHDPLQGQICKCC